jgi:hypothetical protein
MPVVTRCWLVIRLALLPVALCCAAPRPARNAGAPSLPVDVAAQGAAAVAPLLPAAAAAADADVSITAVVRASELRFRVVPGSAVMFCGQPLSWTSWRTERRGLPRPVQPGTSYRDIEIRLEILSSFGDAERAAASALESALAGDSAANRVSCE